MNKAERARRWLASALGVGATAAVLSPLVTGAADSFPISTYPMFSRARGLPTIDAVVGVAADGTERPISPALIASGEVLQTKVIVARAVQDGSAAMSELCRSVALRVAEAGLASTLREVAIVRRRYDPIRYFVVGPAPLQRERLYRCSVPG